MSLGFISAAPILEPTVLKKGTEMIVGLIGEVYGITLPCLQYAGHLFSLGLVYAEVLINLEHYFTSLNILLLYIGFRFRLAKVILENFDTDSADSFLIILIAFQTFLIYHYIHLHSRITINLKFSSLHFCQIHSLDNSCYY